MNKNTIKQPGNGNVAFQNTTVNIYQSPTKRQQLEAAKRKGDQKEVYEIAKEMYKEVDDAHPFYPHYRYRYDGEKLRHEATSREAALKHPLTYRGNFNISRDQMRGFTNLDDLFNDASYKEYGIKISVSELNAFIDGTEVINDREIDEQWELKVISNLPKVKTKLYFLNEDIEKSILDYLEITVEHYNRKSNVLTLSNRKQKTIPITLTITIYLDNQIVQGELVAIQKCNLKVDLRKENQGNIADTLQFLRVLESLKTQKEIIFKNLETNSIFYKCDVHFHGPLEELRERITALNRLLEIERYYNVSFDLPDKVSESEEEAIEILEKSMRKKSIYKTIKTVRWKGINRETVSNLINECTNKKVYSVAEVYTGPEGRIELFGATIKIKERIIFYESLKIKDYDRVSKKLELMDEEDTLTVNFLPGDSNVCKDTFTFDV
ncbi:hypothetical protein AB1K91_11055 [Terribacillus sp. 179-K 1B1 HS]|uniref:hypothetical protein n=1 Tax=Terribacillus sp. 179-K 1B1 HS TaxID=3142388 RepID=UPI0039A3582B